MRPYSSTDLIKLKLAIADLRKVVLREDFAKLCEFLSDLVTKIKPHRERFVIGFLIFRSFVSAQINESNCYG